ncbi:MAG: hypothetical protein LBN04_05050, partial [Oscillospiraceae bacterium]|nr:hypothetical protein [Oscillospiraceae bacterium]
MTQQTINKPTAWANVQKGIRHFGMTRLIIITFFIVLLITAGIAGLNVPSLMSNVLLRAGFNSILVLAMLPGIQCGIGLNMGMT